MAMTQRDFEAIAEAVRRAGESVEGYELSPRDAMLAVTREIASACYEQYRGAYGFNRDRFTEACGYSEA